MNAHCPPLIQPTRRSLIAGLGAAGATIGLGGCFSPSMRVRLLCTITAEVGGKVYSNGTVLEILYWDDGVFRQDWKRHVPYCDLGPHGLLFWDSNGGGELFRPFTMVSEVFGASLRAGYMKISEFERRWRKINGPQPVNFEPSHIYKDQYSYIGLVHIWDRNLRATDGMMLGVIHNGARRKSVQAFAQDGINVTSITFEMTSAPITDVFSTLLPNIDVKRRNATIIDDAKNIGLQLLKVGHLVGGL